MIALLLIIQLITPQLKANTNNFHEYSEPESFNLKSTEFPFDNNQVAIAAPYNENFDGVTAPANAHIGNNFGYIFRSIPTHF
jgi:hypothetical protein